MKTKLLKKNYMQILFRNSFRPLLVLCSYVNKRRFSNKFVKYQRIDRWMKILHTFSAERFMKFNCLFVHLAARQIDEGEKQGGHNAETFPIERITPECFSTITVTMNQMKISCVSHLILDCTQPSNLLSFPSLPLLHPKIEACSSFPSLYISK